MIAWYLFLLLLLETTIFLRGNAKFIWGLDLHPLEWWLYVGWFSSFVGLTSWWGLVAMLGIWKATILVMAVSMTMSFGLKWFFFYPPSLRNFFALGLCWVAVFVAEGDPETIEEAPIEEK